MRYQWAIDESDKDFLLVIHDDFEFRGDIASLYLETALSHPEVGIVGELGQCWRCEYAAVGCTPDRLVQGYRPSVRWPGGSGGSSTAWPCRVNEWAALLSRRAAHVIEQRHDVLFGDCDASGDTAAHWFYLAQREGFGFADPLLPPNNRSDYYFHAEGGSGHSVWVDQGAGRRLYVAADIRLALNRDFGFRWPTRFAHLEP